MDTMGTALWDLYENQKVKGLIGAMRQTLAKIEKSGQADSMWFNAMGEMAQLEKNYTIAIRFFKQAYSDKPRPEYELNLGNALFYYGDFSGAKRVLSGYWEKYPEDIHGLVNLANCHIHLKELEKAKQLCRQGLEGRIVKVPLWNCLGQVAYLEGDFSKAWDYFNQAYSEAPDSVDALFNRANMAYQLDRGDEALRDFAQCLRKDENYEAALLNSAIIRLERGEWAEGKICVQKALCINPSSVEANHILGRLHLSMNEFRSARDVFRTTLRLEPAHAPSMLALAKLHLQEAEIEDAGLLLKQILSKKQLHGEERLATLTLMMELGQHQLCIQYINRLSEADISFDLMKIRVFSQWKIGNIQEAINEIEGLLHKQGESASTLTLLGRMLSQSGADSLAEARYKKALELDPASQSAACELARLNLSRGEGGKAVEILERLLKLNPNDPDCLYNLACCHAKNNNFDDSLYNLKKALENGFQDLDKISADEDLNGIRQFEEFNQLAGLSGSS